MKAEMALSLDEQRWAFAGRCWRGRFPARTVKSRVTKGLVA